MAKVDFYVISDTAPDAHLRYACRIADKAFDEGLRVFIRTDQQQVATRVDELLWTVGDHSFVPHEIATANSPSHPRIAALIGNEPAPSAYRDVLINLGVNLPSNPADYQRIVEIVPSDDERKRQARLRFKAYRDLGIEPATQPITQSAE
jgi:DNA polymerase III subunit chi